MAEGSRALMPLAVRAARLQLAGRDVLRNLNFSLDRPGVTAVLGPNGAGKSLLLRCLHAVQSLDSGVIDWNGLRGDTARGRQGMVFQQPVMLRRSVAGNIRFALKARAVPAGLRGERIEQALAVAGMQGMAQRPARRLSGGERQRLAIARVWACQPDLILLDEPCASLDPWNSREIERLIARLAEQGTPVILATHDLGQARRLADEVVFMAAGEVLEQAPGRDFFSETGPATAQAQAFLRGELVL